MARQIKKHQANKEDKPQKLRHWSNESMLRAIEAIKNGEMGQNRAAFRRRKLCSEKNVPVC